MKRLYLLFLVLISTVFCQEGYAGQMPVRKDTFHISPLFQLSGGVVYSSIDLSRYNSSMIYRGYHLRLVTHIKGMFFLSTEYSDFPEHDSPSAWENVNTRKFDFNGHISFATNNNLTRIFVLTGANKHEWSATRTGHRDISQLAGGIPEGTIVHANRWGLNFGCGFTQILYDYVGVFGDFRFCFGSTNSVEKVRIMDVMTTLGVNFTIPHPSGNNKKTFGIGKKLYKWTQKGGQ